METIEYVCDLLQSELCVMKKLILRWPLNLQIRFNSNIYLLHEGGAMRSHLGQLLQDITISKLENEPLHVDME